jgi:ArsR family transcriptional regulator
LLRRFDQRRRQKRLRYLITLADSRQLPVFTFYRSACDWYTVRLLSGSTSSGQELILYCLPPKRNVIYLPVYPTLYICECLGTPKSNSDCDLLHLVTAAISLYRYIRIYGGGPQVPNESFSPDLERLTKQAEILKALAHPIRLCIAHGLLNSGGCNVTHIQQCLQVPQSTVSQHLTRLRTAGIIKGERHGTEICYQIVSPTAVAVVEALLKS